MWEGQRTELRKTINEFLGCNKELINILIKIPNLKRALWILFAEFSFFIKIASKWFDSEFERFKNRVACFISPLINWKGSLKSLFFDKDAFSLRIFLKYGVSLNILNWRLFSKELRSFHNHSVTKGIRFSFV